MERVMLSRVFIPYSWINLTHFGNDGHGDTGKDLLS